MYDFGALRAAHDQLWAAIASRLRQSISGDVPDTLTRQDELLPLWRNPNLLLGQTCGYPLTTILKQSVRVVLTPIYTAPGCDGAWHRSAIVVRANEQAESLAAFRGRRAAINGWDSNTGMNLLRASVAPLARDGHFFGAISITGSHHASLLQVAAGEADVAAVDCVSLAHLSRIEPHLAAATRILDWTRQSPGLPMITAAATGAATLTPLRAALVEVAEDPALSEARDTLLIGGFEALPYETYRAVTQLEEAAAAQGYPRLR